MFEFSLSTPPPKRNKEEGVARPCRDPGSVGKKKKKKKEATLVLANTLPTRKEDMARTFMGLGSADAHRRRGGGGASEKKTKDGVIP